MKLTYGNRPPFDEPDDHVRSYARWEKSADEQPTRRQKQVADTLLEAAARLAEIGRQRLRLDLMDIAVRVLEGDSYTYWPRKE